MAHIVVSFLLLVLSGALWRYIAFSGHWQPNIIALYAMFFGASTRRLSAAVALAVTIGCIADLVLGGPRGAIGLVSGLVALFGYFVRKRVVVLGFFSRIVFGFAAAIAAAAATRLLWPVIGTFSLQEFDSYWIYMVQVAIVTGLVSPLLIRLFLQIDTWFAYSCPDTAFEGEGPL